MNLFLLSAAASLFLLGIVHSVLGEMLIFRALRADSMVPTKQVGPLLERHMRILWATWHLATLLGWSVAAQLYLDSSTSYNGHAQAMAPWMFASSALVAFATKGRHPGWLGFVVIALLCWFS